LSFEKEDEINEKDCYTCEDLNLIVL